MIYHIQDNKILINLEMQVTNQLNWRDRSVMYLCRSFDQLNHGQDYESAKPAVHIGLLDYSLFIDQPEFYASYKLINVKSHQTYSDGLTLNVLDLTRINLATEEDKKYNIHEWARLFKATTWEEIKMLASKNEYLQEAAETIFRMNADDLVRKQCYDREEHYQDLRNYERKIERDRIEYEQDKRNYERKIERDRIEYEQNKRNYERKIEHDRVEYEQDKRNYEKKIEQDRTEYEQNKRNYERKIEHDRVEYERNKRNYERKIAHDRVEYEQDKRNYEKKIEQDRMEYEQNKRNYERLLAEKEEKIEQLRAALDALKQQT